MLSYLWKGKEQKKEENENPELAMREACDAHGDFASNADGTMQWEAFLIFRSIIMRQACREFAKYKEDLNQRKLEAFKARDQPVYVAVFREGQQKFNNCIATITKKACEWIELEPENYKLSIQTYFGDEAKRAEITKVDTETRLQLENKEITEDISVFIKASKFKFKRDMDMYRKLQQLKFTTAPQQQQEIAQIEMSKTSDAILLEFGFDLSHLVRATQHFNLTENEELKSFQKIVIAQKEQEEKQAFERATPKPEVMQKLLAEADALGKPEYKQDGTMTFDFFLESSKLIIKYTFDFTKEGLAKHAMDRRAAVKEKDLEKCQKLILETANWEQLATQIIQANVYQHLKVPKPVFEKSMQVYMMDPDKRAIYEDEIQKLRETLRDRKPVELTREQCIDSIKHLEKAKYEAQIKMYDMVRTQRIPPQMINAIIKVEKLKADDEFFNAFGIEEEDVEPSIKRLNLEEDAEVKAILTEWENKSKEFLESKKDETAKIMAAAAEFKARMEAEEKEALAQKGAQGTTETPTEKTE